MNICTINIADKDYDLCLNREAVKVIENKGFNIQTFVNKPVTMTELLWFAGFIPNYKEVNQNLSVKLLETYRAEGGDVNEVIEFLAEEYSNFVNAQTDTATKKAKIVRE